ncbi:MAG: hypothetical protein K2Y13_09450, partial [Burkholderiaceae bacterium]|nr:hypothetical protein [Burkholderiaceae bacterium]
FQRQFVDRFDQQLDHFVALTATSPRIRPASPASIWCRCSSKRNQPPKQAAANKKGEPRFALFYVSPV